jgi:hypothetical protein
MWNNSLQESGKCSDSAKFTISSDLFLFLTDGTDDLLLVLKFQMN